MKGGSPPRDEVACNGRYPHVFRASDDSLYGLGGVLELRLIR